MQDTFTVARMTYAVLEQGHRTFFGTYEECCEYLDNVAWGWDSAIRLFDVGIIPCDDEEEAD